MMMTKNDAIEIAELLNKRNELSVKYSFDDILSKKENYLFIKEGDKIVACGESIKVQWYQNEIKHISVHKDFEGKRFGSKILKLVEEKSIKDNARVLQCTVRTDNENSIRLFTRKGYKKVNSFFNKKTKNWVFIFQKVISIE
jgi:ribosomal protein S18 acetylase RimI-like enzyme